MKYQQVILVNKHNKHTANVRTKAFIIRNIYICEKSTK